MWLEIYRSKTRCTYPDESMWYSYAFQRIEAVEVNLDGHLIGWTDDSGPEPYAIVDIPDDTQVIHDEDGWYLQVPECLAPLDAEVIYELAVEHTFGMSVVQECRAETQQEVSHFLRNDRRFNPVSRSVAFYEFGADIMDL